MPKSKHRRKAGEKAVPHPGRQRAEPSGWVASRRHGPERRRQAACRHQRPRRTQPICRCSPPRPTSPCAGKGQADRQRGRTR